MKNQIVLCFLACLAFTGCAATESDRDVVSGSNALTGDTKTDPAPTTETAPPPAPEPAAKPDSNSAAVEATNTCLTGLKGAIFNGGSGSIEEFNSRAKAECGFDANAGAEPDPAPNAPSPEYVACATAVKAEVASGQLAIERYNDAIAARCSSTVPAK